jgi:hypothetical protein
VQHLGVPLIVVLGHSGCGAVQTAMASDDTQGQIATLVASIQPAVKLAKTGPGEALDQAVRINIAMVVRQLRTAAPILAPLVEEGSIKLWGPLRRQVAWLSCSYDSPLRSHRAPDRFQKASSPAQGVGPQERLE